MDLTFRPDARLVAWAVGATLALAGAGVAGAQSCTESCHAIRLCDSSTHPYSSRPVLSMPASFSPSNGDGTKDLTLVQEDGWYHLFYIRSARNVIQDSTEKVLGHARSRNLYSWEELPDVMPVRPDSWDNFHVWAPSIVKRNGVFNMFYAGVTNDATHNRTQSIGLATSTDLMNWTRLDQPVYACEQSGWMFCTSSVGASCEMRDPFVMPDPAVPGRWLMYYAGGLTSDPFQMRPGLAASDGDFTQWHEIGPLWTSHAWWTQTAKYESPCVFSHGRLWFHLFTTNAGQPIEFATTWQAPSDTGAVWDYWNRLANLDCTNAWLQISAEYLQDSNGDEYLADYVGGYIEVRQIGWNTGDAYFTLLTPVRVKSIDWNATSVGAGSPVTLTITTRDSSFTGRTARLQLFEVDDTGAWEPVPPSSVGLPDEVVLTGTRTSIVWAAERVPDGDDSTPNTTEWVVRYLGQTGVLNVGPPGCCTASAPPGDNPMIPMPGGLQPPTAGSARSALDLRVVHDPHAAACRLVVRLPEPTHARLDLYDVRGRRIGVLVDQDLPRGETSIPWDPSGRGPGVYFSRLTTGIGTRTARVVFVP